MKPGVYRGLAMADYLAMPAVSASILKTIIAECPQKARHESWLNPDLKISDATKASDTGSVAHGILLEGSEAGVEVIDPEDHPADKTGNIPTGWTNKSIKAARDAAIEDGKIPILVADMETIRAMVSEARRYLDEEVRPLEPAIWAAFQPDGGESETTIVWDEDGTLCRIRPDRLSADRKLVIDYKTTKTSAEPDRWGRTQMVGMGYYTSAAFYSRGIHATFGHEPAYCYLVQEQDAPFLCSLVGVDPHGLELGAAKIAYGLALWQACAKSGRWPGYPGRVCYPEIPQWEDARWMEREASDFVANLPADRGKMLSAADLDSGIPG